MDLRSQLAALFGRQEQPQQPDSPLVAQIPTGAPGEVLAPSGQMVDQNGPMNDEDLVSMLNGEVGGGRPSPQMRPQAPQQDQAGMDALMMQLQNPEQGITEGPNANIDDATRQRALAFALRNAQQ